MRKLLRKLLAPYRVEFRNSYGKVEQTILTWTGADAAEWVRYSRADQEVHVYNRGKNLLIASRSAR